MVHVALVGGGHIHTPGFVKRLQNRPDVTVKAVWDHDTQRAQRWAGELGCPAFSEIDRIWADNEIRAVVVGAETNRHEPLVLAGAAAGKHLFVEKPLGLGAQDAYRMARAIESAGVLFQTGYFLRGDPIHQFLREQLSAGSFGRVTRYRHTNCHSGSLRGIFDTEYRWMADPAQAGCGGFGDLGTHALDIMMWLMGEPTRVTATMGVATARYGDCDEYGEGLLEFANGVAGSLAAGWVDIAHPINLILSGTEGHAYVLNGQLYVESTHIPGADGKTPWTDLPAAWPHAFELFLDAVGGKEGVPLVSAREAAARSAVMEAMYTAAKRHTWEQPASA